MGAEFRGREYERLCEAATTTRERLVVRLAGESGVRPAEQVRIRPGDIDRRRFDGTVHHFLLVRADDGEVTRRAYLPSGLASQIDEYAATTGTDPGGRLLDVTPRRIQMLVSEVTARAAKITDNGRFEDIASDDLRRYFARRLLVEEDIDPRVVRAVGGWNQLAALDPYVEDVGDADIAAAFEESGGSVGTPGGPSFDDTAGVAVLDMDEDGRIVGYEGSLEVLLGREPRSLVGHPFGELFTDDERDRAQPKELLAAAGREDLTVADCWLCQENGGRIRLSVLVCARRDGGALEGFTALLRRTGSDNELTAGAFRRAFDAAGQPACLAAVSGEIEYINAAFEELIGYTQSEAIGRTAEDLLSSGEDTDEFYAELRETVLVGEIWTGQVTARRKTGERVHVRQTVAPVQDESGDVTFVVVVGTDVTERVRRERALARRCETLEGLEALVADINAAGRELIDASTREEIEAAVCASLADSDAYIGAWIGGTDPGEPRIRPREWAGLTGNSAPVETETAELETALETGEPRVTGGAFAADIVGPFDENAVAGTRAAGVVPIAYGETTYGLLVVFTDRGTAFGDRERTLLSDLGARIGHAVTAIERRNLLLADTVVELEFGCTDEGAFLVAASDDHDCSCALEAVVPVAEGSLLFYVTLSGASPDSFLDTATEYDGVVDGRYIREYSDRSLLEFTVEGDSPALTLTELGATIRSAAVESGDGTYQAEIARESDVRGVVEGLQAVFPETSLRAKHAVDQPVETVAEFQDTLAEKLTDKQRAALRAAYFAGYFDWPRGSTAEEVANSMGVSSPTLHNHLRKAERKLLAAFFEYTRDHLGADVPHED